MSDDFIPNDHCTEDDLDDGHDDTFLRPEDVALISTLKSESDLACVLVITAIVDDRMERILRGFLRDGSTADRMFKDGGSLGSLRAKADFGYLLNIYDKRMYRTLQLLGEIRNIFAHSMFEVTFESEEIKKRYKEIRKICGKLAWMGETIRGQYIGFLLLTNGILHIAAETIEKCQPVYPERLKHWFDKKWSEANSKDPYEDPIDPRLRHPINYKDQN